MARRRWLVALLMVSQPALAARPVPHPAGRTPGPAAPLVRVEHDAYGCADPRTALVLADPRNPHLSDEVWVGYMMSRGQCAKVTPYEPWRLVGRQGTLVRLAPARNVALSVPLFVPAAALAAAFVEVPPGERAAPAPVAVPAPPAGYAPTTTPAPSGVVRLMPAYAGAPRRAGAAELPPDNPGEAYANAMRQAGHDTPWALLLASTAALAGIVGVWAYLRRRGGA